MPPILALLVVGVILIILSQTVLANPQQAQAQRWVGAVGWICVAIAVVVLLYTFLVSGKFASLGLAVLT